VVFNSYAMLRGKNISVIIPCLNEERGLGYVLSTMPRFIDEVVVVDNISTDNSVAVAKKYGAKVVREDGRGYGRVLLRGLEYAAGEIIIIIDGDGTYPVEAFEDLCASLEDRNYDFVSGCRFPLEPRGTMPFLKILGNRLISSWVSATFKVNIKDSQSGLMVFKREILGDIRMFNLGMGFSQEIKIKAWCNGRIRCVEKHISYHKRIGKVKFRMFQDSCRNLLDLFYLYKELKSCARV
jgi:glycosyltransferase involved in cell wall biosynthesis